MKRISALCALAIAVASLTPTAAPAAERPTSVKGCAKPTSKAHVPATLKQPTSVDKKLAKTMTITTNCGVITIALDPAAPQTVTNLATLARSKYFDGSFCHRLTTEGIYVLQCGDPSAQGNGSPGSWKGYKDENLPTKKILTYPAGTVAMANSGPNTNGSQFFLVYKDTTLPPSYTIWGKIKTGLPLLLRIEKVGAYQVDQSTGNAYYAGDGIPVQPIEIKSVTVR
ncbi:peptidyl-prolyl cis-trans isomerase B (cyclophilin B) [Candidatus Planktophila lacus]|jgi:peptidyl-prolyl cis-trans isomerase B (cyclophilin B)|uniref:peptidylprolyl isomerase n=1 Tax=Candidatus Planktophila lacus TaxID=1884913 RepID=UPI000BACE699|nr:peptidylprolyl isomerase [Candidatus Planktophila lacus]ASY25429.1 peptidyl-prolyl cis-trans isomerase B (cyclophilin B) [Candidatus Planktophila lacus]